MTDDGGSDRTSSTAVADCVAKESLRSLRGALDSYVLHFSMSTMAGARSSLVNDSSSGKPL